MTILFTILVLGGGTWPLLKVLGVDFKDVPLTRYGTNYDERRGSDVSISDVPKRGLWNKLAEFDKECMQPLFRREIVPARLP
jgi:hypothetical protein